MGMKQVIDGKVYNTETAGKIASASFGESRSDFEYWEETLYRTKRGQFFTAGEGGPMTKYAQSNGGASWAGDGMELLTEAEALAWCEHNHVDPDVIAEHFSIEEG